MNSTNKKLNPEFVLYPAFAILVMATAGFPFFWDTVQLASRHADFFYTSNFRTIILPNEIDSGHIPTLGIYLAAVWKIFGRSLIASHLAMLPFVLGIVFQAVKLTRKFIPVAWQTAALIIILIDPVLLAQCTLVSPDILLVFFFLMAVNNISEKKRIFYSIALAGLSLTSMRGMMCVAGFFVADAIIIYVNRKKSVNEQKVVKRMIRIAIDYLPAILIAGTFFYWHFHKTGWIGYHSEMPWYPLFERASFSGALHNTLILGWRIIDFGHLFVWITAIACLLHYFRHKPSFTDNFVLLTVISITIFLSIAHAFILYTNLSGHRYLLPVYLIFTLLVCHSLYNYSDVTFPKKFFTWILILGLLSGNFWIYPDRIAKGWDSTLAYLPYFPLRNKMINFMEKEGIKIEETGTCFPNTGNLDRIDLKGDMRSFAEKDMEKNKYFFYSNIYNDLTDKELSELKNKWQLLKENNFLQVKIMLYKNPDLNDPRLVE